MEDGASGTWGFSTNSGPCSRTVIVYGQVIADDVFGGICMIPIKGIIEDIREFTQMQIRKVA